MYHIRTATDTRHHTPPPLAHITVYTRSICPTLARFSPAPVGLFSRSRLRGTQGGRLHTTAQVLGPGRAPWRVLWAFQVAKSGK